MLQGARQRALEEANASSSGRRARFPSCRSLEAAGQANGGDNAQLMTKQKRDQETKRVALLREERKAAAAAGLRRGETVEEFNIASRVGSVADDGPVVGARAVASVSGAGVCTSYDLSNKSNWRKLTPAEMLQQQAPMIPRAVIETPNQLVNINGTNITTPVHVASVDLPVGDEEDTETSAKKASNGVSETDITQGVGRDENETELVQEGRLLEVGAGDGGSDGDPLCEYKGCTRGATSWVNGIDSYLW